MSSNAANSAAKRRRAGVPNNLFQQQNKSVLQNQQQQRFQQPYTPAQSQNNNVSSGSVMLKKVPIDENIVKQQQTRQQQIRQQQMRQQQMRQQQMRQQQQQQQQQQQEQEQQRQRQQEEELRQQEEFQNNNSKNLKGPVQVHPMMLLHQHNARINNLENSIKTMIEQTISKQLEGKNLQENTNNISIREESKQENNNLNNKKDINNEVTEYIEEIGEEINKMAVNTNYESTIVTNNDQEILKEKIITIVENSFDFNVFQENLETINNAHKSSEVLINSRLKSAEDLVNELKNKVDNSSNNSNNSNNKEDFDKDISSLKQIMETKLSEMEIENKKLKETINVQNNTISNYQDRFNSIDENLKNLLDKVDKQPVINTLEQENIGVLPIEEVLVAEEVGNTTTLDDLINEESDNSLQDFDNNLKIDLESTEPVIEQATEEIDFEKAVDDAVQKSTEKTDKKSKKKGKK